MAFVLKGCSHRKFSVIIGFFVVCLTSLQVQAESPDNVHALVYSSTSAELFFTPLPGQLTRITRNGELIGSFDTHSLHVEDLDPSERYRFELRSESPQGQVGSSSRIVDIYTGDFQLPVRFIGSSLSVSVTLQGSVNEETSPVALLALPEQNISDESPDALNLSDISSSVVQNDTLLNNPVTACIAAGASLGEAIDNFDLQCAAVSRTDCDPVDGGWTCSSEVIGESAPRQLASLESISSSPDAADNSTSLLVSTSTIPDLTPLPEWIDSYSAGGQCYCASNFDHGIADRIIETNNGAMTVRGVCAAIGPGPGVGDNPRYNDVQCGHGPDNGQRDELLCPGRIDVGAEGCLVQGPTWNLSTLFPPTAGTLGRVAPNDLVSLHYDNAPDRDDGHALVAGRVLTDFFGVGNVIAVNGTHGFERRAAFHEESQPLFNQTWPNGYDAFEDRRGSVLAVASRWSNTISTGGHVWVAEGGPMDFSADVLRELPSDFRRSVTIVQHSHGYNEDQTNPVNVTYVENNANYIRIDNGNLGGNSTADLNIDSTSPSHPFVTGALSSRWSTYWQLAFDYLPVTNKLDFSDTVEYLWILDIPQSEVNNPTDFTNRYF